MSARDSALRTERVDRSYCIETADAKEAQHDVFGNGGREKVSTFCKKSAAMIGLRSCLPSQASSTRLAYVLDSFTTSFQLSPRSKMKLFRKSSSCTQGEDRDNKQSAYLIINRGTGQDSEASLVLVELLLINIRAASATAKRQVRHAQESERTHALGDFRFTAIYKRKKRRKYQSKSFANLAK